MLPFEFVLCTFEFLMHFSLCTAFGTLQGRIAYKSHFDEEVLLMLEAFSQILRILFPNWCIFCQTNEIWTDEHLGVVGTF